MIKKYIPKDIEPKWQEKWDDSGFNKIDLSDSTDHEYVLTEFTYPSGDLHIGHWFAFAVPDILARTKHMQGKKVFFPNGFDAFGLPAESAAIKRNIHPQDWTLSNIENMKKQFSRMGATYNWDHEVITCLPNYYKWNQWIFLKMLEKGIAYKGKFLSNWCPFDQTVLANEQVVNGKCDRCGSEVVQKEISQWFLKITEYADRLSWKDNLVDWPKSLKEGQNNWIGRSEGLVISFDEIKVFTTRPDTLFGVTFLVISPEHPLLASLTTEENKEKVEQYVRQSANKSELERKENKEKTGIFTGSFVRRPINGEKIPVWVADYVLTSYGTGAVMGVPAHDERDFEFAKKFDLPIKPVIEPVMGEKQENEEFRKSIVAVVYDPKSEKYLSIKWKKELGGNLFVGGGIDEGEDSIEAALREIKEETGYQDLKTLGTTEKIHYHYRAHSKGVNRKIEAIGIYFELLSNKKVDVHLEKDEEGKFEVVWLTKEEVEKQVKDELHKYVFNNLINGSLYDGEGLLFNSDNFNGLSTWEAREKISDYIEKQQLGERQVQYHLHDWSVSRQRYWGTPIPIIYCDNCGTVPVPEKDLPVELPYKVDYAPKGKPPLATAEDWVNVKCPNCDGPATREVETMDTFFDSSWYFLRYLDPQNSATIFDKKVVADWMPLGIYFGGAEHTLGHTLYSRFFVKFLKDLGLIDFDEYALKRVNRGLILGPDGQKMSKSKGNVVNPDEQVEQFGADAVRLYLAFIGPYTDTVAPWTTEGVNGVYHFLQRVWGLQEKLKTQSASQDDLKIMHKTIKKVTTDIADIKFNTAVASLMEWLNYLSKKDSVSEEEYKTYLLLLAPFAPHMTEELWSELFKDKKSQNWSIHQQSWPKFEDKYLEDEEIRLVVQINGKVRDIMLLEKGDEGDREIVERKVLENEKVKKFLEGRKPKNIVYIAGKVINLVI